MCPLPTCTKYICSSTVRDLRFFPRLDPAMFPVQILLCSPRSLWSPRPPLYFDYLGCLAPVQAGVTSAHACTVMCPQSGHVLHLLRAGSLSSGFCSSPAPVPGFSRKGRGWTPVRFPGVATRPTLLHHSVRPLPDSSLHLTQGSVLLSLTVILPSIIN